MTTPTDKSEVSLRDYDPVECLREEVTRFKDTNRFSPMTVTNFFVQAGLVLVELDKARSQLTDLRAQVEQSGERSEKLSTDKRRLADENAELKALLIKQREQIDKANADGAVMRGALEFIGCRVKHPDDSKLPGCPVCEAVDKALSTSCGADLLARCREAVRVLESCVLTFGHHHAEGNNEQSCPTCIAQRSIGAWS